MRGLIAVAYAGGKGLMLVGSVMEACRDVRATEVGKVGKVLTARTR